MSYFEYSSSNGIIKEITIGQSSWSEAIPGLCNTMCPEEEVEIRSREHLVHILEVVEGERKLVKSFSRSAADAKMAVPSLLRPFQVLKETVQYLLFDVTKRSDVPISVVYDFVNDRLRAVRQDMTIQRLTQEQNRILLDPMVRFYVLYGYRLCEYPVKVFNPILNKKYLMQCLLWYLDCTKMSDPSDNVETIMAYLSSMQIKNASRYLYDDRALMESLYIICNLDNVHPLVRYSQLPERLKNAPKLKLSYKLAVANMQGNFVRVTKLSRQLCPLTLSAFYVYLPVVQRKALQVMSHAYSSKRLTVPCETLTAWLLFYSDAQASEVCRYYGLEVEGNRVHFAKADFKHELAVLPPKKKSTSLDVI